MGPPEHGRRHAHVDREHADPALVRHDEPRTVDGRKRLPDRALADLVAALAQRPFRPARLEVRAVVLGADNDYGKTQAAAPGGQPAPIFRPPEASAVVPPSRVAFLRAQIEHTVRAQPTLKLPRSAQLPPREAEPIRDPPIGPELGQPRLQTPAAFQVAVGLQHPVILPMASRAGRRPVVDPFGRVGRLLEAPPRRVLGRGDEIEPLDKRLGPPRRAAA